MNQVEQELSKRLAAESAVSLVKSGMAIGLGSRSTAEIVIRMIAEKVQGGLRIVGVATSHESEALARELGIPVSTLAEHPQLDLTIDGADEVERGSLDLIKGRGGALLREKIVASSSWQLIIVVDESKVVERLGPPGKLPVEVVPFNWGSTALRLERLGWQPLLRATPEGAPYITDGGHYILDCSRDSSSPWQSLASELDGVVGVVEHGMFLAMATEVHVGNSLGSRIFRRAFNPTKYGQQWGKTAPFVGKHLVSI